MNELWALIIGTSIGCMGLMLVSYWQIRQYKYAIMPAWLTSLLFIMSLYITGKEKGFNNLGPFIVNGICAIASIIVSIIITVLFFKDKANIESKPIGIRQIIIYIVIAFIPPALVHVII